MNFLTRYSATIFKNLPQHMESLIQSADTNIVHRFRVDVKRIHALLFMVNSMDDAALKEPEFLREVYQAAGKLREIQLEVKSFREQKLDMLEKSAWTELLKRKEQKKKGH
jgi:hypothetical protein